MPSRNAWITGLVALAGLAAGTAVTAHLPTIDDVLAAPVEHRAGVGGTVELRNARVTLESVDAAHQVKGGLRSATSQHGVYVVVTYVVSPTHKTGGVDSPTILARDGRRFGGPSPTGLCPVTQPLLTVRCRQAVEVTPDALAGAQLRIAAQAFTTGSGDDVAVFDLGIDDARAKELAATTATADMTEQEPVR